MLHQRTNKGYRYEANVTIANGKQIMSHAINASHIMPMPRLPMENHWLGQYVLSGKVGSRCSRSNRTGIANMLTDQVVT